MTVALRKPMTREEFFVWAEAQENPYEFDGFQPIAMTRSDLGHSRVIRNISRQLSNRLAGSPCEALGPEAAVATIGNKVRYPDAVVTCSPFSNRDRLVPNPVIVFEVVSPTSVRMDRVVKLHEYQAVPSIRRYVIIEPESIAVTVLSHDREGAMFMTAGLAEGDVLDLPEIDVHLPVADIYEGVGET